MKWLVGVLVFLLPFASQALGQQDRLGHLRLKDRLDRPTDGYCLDILGVGRTLRIDVPIFAHSCKPRLTPDSKVRIRADGKISFPDVGLCITAFGVNGRALAGSPIILRPCGHRAPFFEAGPLQSFELKGDGRIVLQGTDLCLAVGEMSDSTYSAQDRWRVLSVQHCRDTPAKYLAWELSTGPSTER